MDFTGGDVPLLRMLLGGPKFDRGERKALSESVAAGVGEVLNCCHGAAKRRLGVDSVGDMK